MLIQPNTLNFVNPDRLGIITINTNEQIELFCSGSFVAPFTNTRTLFATCQTDTNWLVNGETRVFNTLACTGQVFHTARRTGQICFDGSTHTEVGFNLAVNRFLVTHNICHDEVAEATRYVYYTQTPSNMGFQRSFPRPGFLTGDFFGRNVNNLYTQVTQRQTFARILGQDRVDEMYAIHTDAFLARGHLMANVDNIFGSHMRASFYFINAQPQWQTFNGGNWERVESGVRAFIADRNIDCEIYTGVHGVLSVRDQNGVFRELYLDFDAQGRGLIPVPSLYYKVVLHRPTNHGIVFIGVNNPHATSADIANRHTICSDISASVNWPINWTTPVGRTSILRGFSYMCTISDFRRVVTNLPPTVNAASLLY